MAEKIQEWKEEDTSDTSEKPDKYVGKNPIIEQHFGSPREYDSFKIGEIRHDLFSTPIYLGDDSNHAEITDEYTQKGYDLINSLDVAGTVSEGWLEGQATDDKKVKDTRGTTSFFNGNLAAHPEWDKLNGYILGMALRMLSDTIPDHLLKGFTIANSWVTLYPDQAYVPEHIHSCFEISGVYYLKAQGGKDSGMLTFRDPAWVTKTMNIWGPGTRIFPGPSTNMTFPTRTGMMVLFPSWLPHSTLPNNSGEDRMIYSFNLITDNARLRLVHNYGDLNR